MTPIVLRPQQAFQREVALADAGVGPVQFSVEGEHQADSVLGDGMG
jgi:hypothetical protein